MMYPDYRVLQKQLTADVVTITPCNKCYVYQFNYYRFRCGQLYIILYKKTLK